jgi:hypothetical protein
MPLLRYLCDDQCHLICVPYTVEFLHFMAQDLDIKRCWFHTKASWPHYDIPKRRVVEIQAKCTVMTAQALLAIMKEVWPKPHTWRVPTQPKGNRV